MDITIEAVYEQGVFRPLSPVELNDGERVFVTLPFRPSKPKSPEEIDDLIQQARKVFEGFTDEEVEQISQAWNRK